MGGLILEGLEGDAVGKVTAGSLTDNWKNIPESWGRARASVPSGLALKLNSKPSWWSVNQ